MRGPGRGQGPGRRRDVDNERSLVFASVVSFALFRAVTCTRCLRAFQEGLLLVIYTAVWAKFSIATCGMVEQEYDVVALRRKRAEEFNE